IHLDFRCLINAWIQWLAVEFPTQQNREFQNVDQGIFLEEQGNLNQATASPLELNMLCVIASSQSAPQEVRFTSNGDQIDAAPRTAAMCQLRRNAPQKKALLSPRRQWEASWASP